MVHALVPSEVDRVYVGSVEVLLRGLAESHLGLTGLV